MTADACATPGCGHHQLAHDPNGCNPDQSKCTCTAYLPPRPVPEEALTAYEWWLDLRAQQDRKLREGIQAVGGDPE